MIKVPQITIDLDVEPCIPDGWKVVEHQRGGQFLFSPSRVKLYLDEGQQGTRYINGIKLYNQLKNKQVVNALMLDWYLANPQHIPEDWRSKAVCFWGTVYQGLGGRLCVRCLFWDHNQWDSGFHRFVDNWDASAPALVFVGGD